MRTIRIISLTQLALLLLAACTLFMLDGGVGKILPVLGTLALAAVCTLAHLRFVAVMDAAKATAKAGVDADSAAYSGVTAEAETPPAEDAACPAETAPQPVADGKAVPQSIHTVLVAEDNEINQAILGELLDQMGVKVVLASDGQEAVDIVKEWKIALVVMDIEMPVMDGMEATRIIRGMGYTPRNLPILAMTGNTDASSRMDGMSLGMNDYLTKPVNPEELHAALDKWLPGGLARPDGQPGKQGAKISEKNAIINMDAGIAATGGNKKLYQNLLERFVEHYGHGLSRIRELLLKEDYVAAARLAHTIKGVAGNLGMTRVAELTKTMEASLPDVPPDESLLSEYEAVMRETLEYIVSLNLNQVEAVVGDKPLEEESRRALLDLLVDLPKRTESDWGGTQRKLSNFVEPAHGTPHAGHLSALLKAVNDFDLEGMGQYSARLQQSLEASSGQAA
ncbi:MAG: response regulator [Desulfovibrio sp.]|jgi:CheY-like chemotaxis protein/HPt (histidine-containing phosphotransfer) domain-containing protein|nr:response regulator [Desulfovibrio sp.]